MDTTTDLGIRIQCVTVDAHDPARLARFWSRALGWRVTDEDDEESVIEPPEGSPANEVAPDILFIRVPEGESVKNRLHFDLRPDDQQAHVDSAARPRGHPRRRGSDRRGAMGRARRPRRQRVLRVGTTGEPIVNG